MKRIFLSCVLWSIPLLGAAFLVLGLLSGCPEEPLIPLPPGPPVTDEVCNGKDDDQNGLVDELLFRRVQAEDGCPVPVGQCHTDWVQCLDGELLCVVEGGPKTETCNNLDDDCDGEVDEDLAVIFTYPNDLYPGTAGIGECRPSVTQCRNGADYTIAAKLPRAEEIGCGDGEDDDCDGEIDEDALLDGDGVVAISFVVDVSGSMSGHFAEIKRGLCFLALDSPAGSIFSLTVYGLNPAPGVVLASDFVGATAICDALVNSVPGGLNGGEEYQVEGVLAIPPWPTGFYRHVVFVSDENNHIYSVTGSDVAEVLAQCSGPGQEGDVPGTGYELHAFLGAAPEEWQPALDGCGGNPEQPLRDVGVADLVLAQEFDVPCVE